jgi:hypothetical protein
MVAGDHDHADPCAPRFPDGHGRFFARRVDDAHGADVNELAFE